MSDSASADIDDDAIAMGLQGTRIVQNFDMSMPDVIL